ncbi:hypothetical protein ACR03S_05295 [Limimaricola variabilis]
MKVKFLPQGGFNKIGAFVEYDGEEPLPNAEEYQREGFISFTAICKELILCNHLTVKDDVDGSKKEPPEFSAFMSGDALIEDDLHGKWRLSFLGQAKEHDRVRISLHRTMGKEKVHFQGYYRKKDFEFEGSDKFFVEARLAQERFDLIQEQMSQPGAELHIRIDPAMFANFYATWSPMNRVGRVIKFLNNIKDVDNPEDIPADFDLADTKQEWRSEPDADPIRLYVRRPLREAPPLADTEYKDSIYREALTAPPRHDVSDAASPRVERAIERLASRAAALLWVVSAIGILMLLRLIGGLA